jgi:hypothetical protein
MRKSRIFDTIHKELVRLSKSKKSFTRVDLKRLISKHQKYSVFVYKHSDINNLGKLTLFFKRGKTINRLISFTVDINVLKEYKKKN